MRISPARVVTDCEVDYRTALWLVYPQWYVLSAKVRTFIGFLLDKIGKSQIWRKVGSKT